LVSERILRVAVGIVERPDGSVLLARRPDGKPYAGYWEFPGGKVEAGESVAQALARELAEELGLSEVHAVPWLRVDHRYPHATVQLHFRRVRQWNRRHEPQAREGQQLAWRHPLALELRPLLPASIRPIRWLQLPPVYRISCAALLGPTEFIQRLDALLTCAESLADPVWLQLREPELSAADGQSLFARLWHWRMHRPLRLIVSSRHAPAWASQADGVHLTARDLTSASVRPNHSWVMASCHDRQELQIAGRLGCDLAVLGPVLPSGSHPDHPGIGWAQFSERCSDPALPVMAIGGLSLADLDLARQHGAQGVALLRSGWPGSASPS
jgi:8-oxo-dGTP diphosphatase